MRDTAQLLYMHIAWYLCGHSIVFSKIGRKQEQMARDAPFVKVWNHDGKKGLI